MIKIISALYVFFILVNNSFAQVKNIKAGMWGDTTIWSNKTLPSDTTTIILDYDVEIDTNAVCKSLHTNGHQIRIHENKNLLVGGSSSGISTRVMQYIEDLTATSYHKIDTFNISYDNEGKITALRSISSNFMFLYYYSSSSYYLDILDSPELNIRAYYYLNDDLLIDSGFQYNSTSDSSTEKWIYNSKKQPERHSFYDYSLVMGSKLSYADYYFYDINGNVTKTIRKNLAGDTSQIITYTYNNLAVNMYSLGMVYQPVFSKKIPATITYYYPSSNSTTTINIQYVLDDYQRIVTETQTYSNGNIVKKTWLY